MQLDGYLERLGEGLLHGWLWGGPDAGALTAEFRIDGEAVGAVTADAERGDLAKAGIGSGRHGFGWRVPARFYDGREHRLEVYAAGLDWRVPGGVTATLPAPAHALRIGADGRLRGYVVDPSASGEALEVTLRVGGAAVAQATASEPLTAGLFDGAPTTARGFSLTPPPATLEALLGPDAEMRLLAFERTLEGLRDAVLGSFRLGVVEADAISVLARLSTPLKLARQAVEFSMDGVFAGTATLAPARVGSAAELRLWLDAPADEAADLAGVEIGAVSGGVAVGAPVRHDAEAFGHLNRDVRLQAWTGDAPTHWAVGGGASVTRVPVGGEGRAPEGLPSLVARLELSTSGGGLSQALTPPPGPSRAVDVHLGARTDAPGAVEVRLSGRTAGGDPWTVARSATVWRDWSVRAMRLTAPEDASADGAVTLSLATEALTGAWLDIGLLACGAEGAAVGGWVDEDARPLDPEAWNAVRAPDLDGWRPPLRRTLEAPRLELAAGWRVNASESNPQASLTLHGVELPAEADGGARRQAYGARLRCAGLGGFVRLEATLDADVLARGEADLLRFHASSPTLTRCQIRRVLVLRRSLRPAPDARVDYAWVATLTGAVGVGHEGGRMVERSIPLPSRKLVRAAAEACRRDRDTTLALVFEFEGEAPIDAAIADVRLGASGERASRPEGYVSLEDPHIRAQIGVVKGVGRWGSPVALDAADAPARPECAARPWRWTSPATSVEVLVCVHNAAEEALACLASLRAETTVPHTVTVIDDASTLATRTVLEAAVAVAPWMRLASHSENLGYTRSANLGLSRSTADWVVLLNSDTVVTTGWLEGLLACARSDDAIAMVGPISNAASWQSAPALQDEAGRWMINALPDGMDANAMAALVAAHSLHAYPRAPLLNGFCMLMKRSAVDGVGYFDEAAFPVGYGEENDLCIRLAKAGHALAIADDVYVHHAKSASFGGARRAELAKAGTAAVRAKHPDVDLRALQRRLAECTPLIALRERLERALAERSPAS